MGAVRGAGSGSCPAPGPALVPSVPSCLTAGQTPAASVPLTFARALPGFFFGYAGSGRLSSIGSSWMMTSAPG
jgi:hypothetical protein